MTRLSHPACLPVTLLAILSGVLSLCCFAAEPSPAPAPSTAQNVYAQARLRPTVMRAVRWTTGFWAEREALCRNIIVPEMKKALLAPDNSACLVNFRIGAGLEKGEHQGTDWGDGDCYKWIEAMAWLYATVPSPDLDREMDEWIERIAKTQAPDGYISTQIQLDPSKKRWENLHHHELYNMGHLMTAASVHAEATGKDNFLKLARKVADYLDGVFSPRPPELAHMDFNPSHIMGLMDLFRATGEVRYRNLANVFITMRGSQPVPPLSKRNFGEQPGDLTQDRKPLRKETEAVGHAVTGGYLYCGAADLVAETGEKALSDALVRIWDDMTSRKMYITGGNGAMRDGVSIRKDPVHEAFGFPYDLPPRMGYNETCANIASAMFGWRMLLLNGEARYADVMERVFHNAMLSAMSVDGTHFCYCNPLERRRNAALGHHDTEHRWVTHTCYCCPPSVARTLARLHTYAYSWSTEGGLWVNLYGGNSLDQAVPGVGRWRLKQTTDYPWDDSVRFEFQETPAQPVPFCLRIPAWADRAKIAVNGQAAEVAIAPGTFARILRTWQAGDTVTLTLPLEVQMLEAHPLVSQAKGQVAVQRGPLVYCLESADLPEGLDIDRVVLPRDAKWSVEKKNNLLGGVAVLTTNALVFPAGEQATGLYRRVTAGQLTPQRIQMIPYYVWNNRQPSDMSVWLPLR